MRPRVRAVLMALSLAVAVAAGTALVVIRLGRPLYYSDGEHAHLGAGAELREAPMLKWMRPQPEHELPGKVRGRVLELPDGSFVFGLARGEERTELVRFDPRRATAPLPLAALTSTGHDLAPSLAPDGRTLYFASDRPHAEGGGYDIWCANLREGEVFAPRPLPAPINTHADETDPLLDASTGELVFARRAAALDARGAFALFRARLDAPPDAADAVQRVLGADDTAGEVVFDREPALSADGRALFFVRQRGFALPTLMRAWRHAGTFATPVELSLAVHDAKLRAPVLLAGGRALRLLDAERSLLYRAQAAEVYPWWEGQAWLERLLLLTLLLALLIWILLALGQRWRALDIVTWCLIASLLLHLAILAWLRGVEIVRHFRSPPPRLGDIEVSLVASGGSVDVSGASPGPELAHELQFSGHSAQVTAELPASAQAAAQAAARAREAEQTLEQPQANTPEVTTPSLQDAAAAAALRAQQAAERALVAAPSSAVDAQALAAAQAERRAAERTDAGFPVDVPAAEPRADGATPSPRATHGARTAPTPQAAPPAVAPIAVADAAAAVVAARGTDAVPVVPTSGLPVPGLTAAVPSADADRHAPAPIADPQVAAPRSALSPLQPNAAPPPRADLAAVLAPSANASSGPTQPVVREAIDAPAVAHGSATPAAVAPAAAEQLAPPQAAGSVAVQRGEAAPVAREPVVVAPASTLVAASGTASAPSTRTALPLPQAQPVASPMPRVADGVADAPKLASAARSAAAATSSLPALVGEGVQPAPAEIVAQRAAAPAGEEATPTLTGPRDVLTAPPVATATPSARAPRDVAAAPTLAAPRAQLQEALDPASALPAASGNVTRAPAVAQLHEAGPVGPAQPVNPSPAPSLSAGAPTNGAESVVVAPRSVLESAQPIARPAQRDGVEVAPRRAPSPRLALRDESGAPPAATTPPATLSKPALPLATLSLPPLSSPLAAAVVTTSRRALRDAGSADVSRGIRPPPSLVPLAQPLVDSGPGQAHVAAVPDLYRSRFGPDKALALEAFGGSEETEAAVRKGLDYLAAIQRDDGAWGRRRRMHDKYGEVWVGKSALCVLAFLGAGHTQDSDTPHAATVRRALAWLLAQQDEDTGHFGETSAYSHGITTYALAECYAMTKDATLRAPVEKAVAWMLKNQNRGRDRRSHGGWGYFSPTLRPEDRFARTSVTAWMVMALKSAQMSGLDVPHEALADAEAYLVRMFDAEHGYFLYNREPGRLESDWRTLPGSTPAAVFCLLLLNTDPTDERVRQACAWILERAPAAYRRHSLDDFVLRGQGNVYFWYYGSLACFLAGGEVWSAWNRALKLVLLEGQSEDGSFAPIDEYADYAGDTDRDRAYTTAMCVLSLEVYYRYFTPLVKPR